LGVPPDNSRHIWGRQVENREGATFWLKKFNDLNTRGVHDILIAVMGGLTENSESLDAAFPKTTAHACVVHLVFLRHSADDARWRAREGW